jgi:hypothetical protein
VIQRDIIQQASLVADGNNIQTTTFLQYVKELLSLANASFAEAIKVNSTVSGNQYFN